MQSTPIDRSSALHGRHGTTEVGAHVVLGNFQRQQEVKTYTGAPAVHAQANTGPAQGRVAVPAQSPGNTEENTGHEPSNCDTVLTSDNCQLPAESNAGRAYEQVGLDNMLENSDSGLSSGATEVLEGRPKRVSRPIDRLVIGDPGSWHFNRAKPRR